MIRVYGVKNGQCTVDEPKTDDIDLREGTAWIDLYNPTLEEERCIESLLMLDIPTKEEMREIESSSRLYRQDSAVFMTANVITNSESASPVSAAVTFILTSDVLVTLRYDEPLPFRTFAAQAKRASEMCVEPQTIFVNLLDTIVDRAADILEWIAEELDTLSKEIFVIGKKGKDFEIKITRLGRCSDVISKARESLVSLSRLATFALQSSQIRKHDTAKETLSALANDIISINEHVTYLSSKTTFLLDAMLGMINIEQNKIIKFFSVVAVVFLPPTLIASIYGMNFEHMPELVWVFGYPAAIIAMLISMLSPFLYFKSKGWF